MLFGLDPDQDRHFVGPDLDPNYFKGHQQTTRKELKRWISEMEFLKWNHLANLLIRTNSSYCHTSQIVRVTSLFVYKVIRD